MVPEQVQAQQNRVDLPLSFLRIPHIQKIHVCANDSRISTSRISPFSSLRFA